MPPKLTPTLLPSATRKPAAASSTPLPTQTALPSLPDFDQTITFGGGGGGDMDPCAYPGYLPALFGNPAYGMLPQRGILCVWGADFGPSFNLRLNSPDGSLSLSADFSVDSANSKVNWLGAAPDAFAAQALFTDNGTRIDIDILWPLGLPNGSWQVLASGDGLNASGALTVEDTFTQMPRIMALDARMFKEILPVDSEGRHSVQPSSNGNLDILGKNFPANTNIYLLLYQETGEAPGGGQRQASLIYKQAAYSDAAGLVKAQISSPPALEQKYFLVGVAENTPVMINGLLNVSAIGTDYFYIVK